MWSRATGGGSSGGSSGSSGSSGRRRRSSATTPPSSRESVDGAPPTAERTAGVRTERWHRHGTQPPNGSETADSAAAGGASAAADAAAAPTSRAAGPAQSRRQASATAAAQEAMNPAHGCSSRPASHAAQPSSTAFAPATTCGAPMNDTSGRSAEEERRRAQHRESVEKEQSAALQRILRASERDHRSILGLAAMRGSPTNAEVTKAFRQQSLLVHPDKNGAHEAEEAFKKLQAAYAALKEELNRPSAPQASYYTPTAAAAEFYASARYASSPGAGYGYPYAGGASYRDQRRPGSEGQAGGGRRGDDYGPYSRAHAGWQGQGGRESNSHFNPHNHDWSRRGYTEHSGKSYARGSEWSNRR